MTQHYLVIETFRDGNARPVYERLADHGRLIPPGLSFVSSWVTDDLARCYQVMECTDREVLDAWMAEWDDLVQFEVHPVIDSDQARRRALGLGDA